MMYLDVHFNLSALYSTSTFVCLGTVSRIFKICSCVIRNTLWYVDDELNLRKQLQLKWDFLAFRLVVTHAVWLHYKFKKVLHQAILHL